MLFHYTVYNVHKRLQKVIWLGFNMILHIIYRYMCQLSWQREGSDAPCTITHANIYTVMHMYWPQNPWML